MSQQKTERGDGEEEEVKNEKGKDKCKVSRRMSWRKAVGKTGAWNEEARKGKEEGVRQEKKLEKNNNWAVAGWKIMFFLKDTIQNLMRN